MNKKINMLSGKIGANLFKLSTPIIVGSIVLILYSLTDIKFLSYYVGDKAVSAATAAIFYTTFALALLSIPKNGAQILVAQSIGARDYKKARKYARISLIIAFVLSLIALFICFRYSELLIRATGIKSSDLLEGGITFLKFNAIGFPFLFVGVTIAVIISSDGDTIGPFVLILVGVILNIILDYIFLSVIPLGIKGAAGATSTSQAITCILLIIYFKFQRSRLRKMKIFRLDPFYDYVKVLKLGLPVGLNQALLTIVSIIVAANISKFNENVLAIQRLGVQYEGFSWGIMYGLSSGVSTYVAQNYGAKQFKRINEVYKISLNISIVFGLIVTVIFMVFAKSLFSFFFKDPYLINEGVVYMRIIGATQVFQCIEIIVQGVLSGMDKIKEQTIVSSVGTVARVPLIYIFAPIFGLHAIWYVISFSMFAKGIVQFIWYKIIWNNELKGEI